MGDKILLKNRKKNHFELIIAELPLHNLVKVDSSSFTQLSLTWHPKISEIIFQELNPETLLYNLYKIDLDTKKRSIINLPPSRNAIPPLRWSPDGSFLAYVATEKQADLIIYNYKEDRIMLTLPDVDPYSDFQWYGDSTLFYVKKPYLPFLAQVNIHTNELKEFNLLSKGMIRKISVKSDKILFVGREENKEYYQCYEYDFILKNSLMLTSGSYNVNDCRYSNDGSILFYNRNEDGVNKLYCSDSLTNNFIVSESKNGSGFKIDLELNDYIYVTETNFRFPPNLSMLNLKTLQKTVKYEPYDSGYIGLEKPEKLNVENPESGLQIPCFYWGSKYKKENQKTVLYIHGGPFLQSKPSWNIKARLFQEYNFNMLSINYSGSSGYSKKFANQKNLQIQISDILASVKFLNSEFNINNENIILMGSSYGGKLALYANEYLDNIGGVVLISSPLDEEMTNFKKIKKTKLFAFYGNLDPLSDKANIFFKANNLLNSDLLQFELFDEEGHYFHRSSSWSYLYGALTDYYSLE
ncbi:prolyl oligopeptidase family serine peptidase [Flagellimonas sp.]|uniref:alpha/beta hydrolase family protein n=1 Tax=Flagellimonas sp. TaxID=2058762 RepID=UPI003B50039B